MSFGFIISRHVHSEKTNEYWNQCIKSIRKFYPLRDIIIIDDNSNNKLVKPDMEYENIKIIKSEFPGAGELLPYYYFFKYKFFTHAIILHDSVFFQKRIHFEKLIQIPILPLWHFDYRENIYNCLRLTNYLNNADILSEKINFNPVQAFTFRTTDKWHGCFGVQSIISHNFLSKIQQKYNIFILLKHVKTRTDRCALERIMGAIFYREFSGLYKVHSLLGNIWKYEKWGYTYDEYKQNNIYTNLPLVKVWTGR